MPYLLRAGICDTTVLWLGRGAVHFQLQVPTLEDIYPRAQAAGAVTQEPFFRPYGWHMFRMADPAGNHINIYTVPTTTE